ncbi:MAG: 16S rRNA (guanine(527)-N(7))-methyltransferase RsmG [Elusimicrobia bacterium RIFOXYD2_FULL_34_15]|nr:MAG: 16S rRNA (guanine(527)-N(7))-methyltransferase RsmG [Elusimicrobia bacterium RIFOXYD2_FULL_34_15]
MNSKLLEIFLQGLQILKIELNQKQLEQFSIYLKELKEWNSKFNLIGPAADEEIIQKHFLDSLSIVPVIKSKITKQCVLTDIGTGAGFPGIPLKIVLPEISLTLLDSSKKKTEFLRYLCKRLEIEAKIVCGRAEEISNKPEYTKTQDIVTARAVTKIFGIEKLCSPFLKKDGILILQISSKTDFKEIKGEIMEKFIPPSAILPGRMILSLKRGFTLIELMIVVAIIGLLAAIAIPKFANMIRKSKEGATKGALGNLRSAITLYYSDFEGFQYPQNAAAIMNISGPFQTKYVNSMPTVKLGISGHTDTADMDDFNDGDTSTDLGNWGYITSQGKAFVNCIHTDTKGELISGW